MISIFDQKAVDVMSNFPSHKASSAEGQTQNQTKINDDDNNDEEEVLNLKIIVCMKEGDHKKTAGREIICYSSTQSKGKSQQNSTHTKSNMTIHIFLVDLKHWWKRGALIVSQIELS